MFSGDSVRAGEVQKFEALAARWWDVSGPMKPLHMMNPVRAGWVLERIRRRYGSVEGVRVLDVGCGAGLLSEALAKAGCAVTGVDAASEVVEVARRHAGEAGVAVDYRVGTAEAIFLGGERFEVVTALEVIEHVAEPAAFVGTLAGLLEPAGVVFLSTINRTRRSYVTAKVGAEYVLRLLPVGTHEWKQFVTPVELGAMCRAAGLRLADVAGLEFSAGRFVVGRDTGVNYIAVAEAGGSKVLSADDAD